jgi:hypothetical protein
MAANLRADFPGSGCFPIYRRTQTTTGGSTEMEEMDFAGNMGNLCAFYRVGVGIWTNSPGPWVQSRRIVY